MEIVSRKKALENRLIKYFTGKPCKSGHISERFTNGGCIECRRSAKYLEARARYNRKPETIEKTKQDMRTHRLLNNDTINERRRVLHAVNQKRDAGRINAAVSKRRAAKLNATPKWLSETQLAEIQKFYEIAQWYDEPRQVDHIVPLLHPLVCGLHVPWNLQILTAEANMAKSNTFII